MARQLVSEIMRNEVPGSDIPFPTIIPGSYEADLYPTTSSLSPCRSNTTLTTPAFSVGTDNENIQNTIAASILLLAGAIAVAILNGGGKHS